MSLEVNDLVRLISPTGTKRVESGCMEKVELSITAGREAVGEPWIWRISRDFDVKVTIKKANVDTDYGWMQVELEGPVEEIQRATSWLMTTGMNIEANRRSVGVSD